jgi:pyruvate kinase
MDGADGLLLTAETAIGRHAAQAVATMRRIILAAEADGPSPQNQK